VPRILIFIPIILSGGHSEGWCSREIHWNLGDGVEIIGNDFVAHHHERIYQMLN